MSTTEETTGATGPEPTPSETLSDPSPMTAGALGGPDLTPSKSLPDPHDKNTWIGSGDVGKSRVTNGNTIANWMIICGIIAAIIGALVYGTNLDSYEDSSLAVFGASLSQFGVLLAILGLHALAVRFRRS